MLLIPGMGWLELVSNNKTKKMTWQCSNVIGAHYITSALRRRWEQKEKSHFSLEAALKIHRRKTIQTNHWPTLTSRGQPLFWATAPMSDTWWAKSGVNGPLMWGFNCWENTTEGGSVRQQVCHCWIYRFLTMQTWKSKTQQNNQTKLNKMNFNTLLSKTDLTQVDLDELVIFTVLVRDQVVFELLGHRGNLCAGTNTATTFSLRPPHVLSSPTFSPKTLSLS